MVAYTYLINKQLKYRMCPLMMTEVGKTAQGRCTELQGMGMIRVSILEKAAVGLELEGGEGASASRVRTWEKTDPASTEAW